MRVQIVKSGDPSFWYHKKIGRIYEVRVVGESRRTQWLACPEQFKDQSIHFINFSDAVEVSDKVRSVRRIRIL